MITTIKLLPYTQQLLKQCIKIGLIKEEVSDEGGYPSIKHSDGESITFDTGEADLTTYLEGLLKACDLIHCRVVEVVKDDLDEEGRDRV